MTVCCIKGIEGHRESLERAGVKVVVLGISGRLARLAAVPRIARLARRADVVHCTMWDASLWGRLAAVLARRPAIVADHATDRSIQVARDGTPRGSWIALHNRLLERFTYATVACAASQRAVLTGEGVADDKVVHIPNGVPVAELVESATGGATRADLDISADARVVVHVAVFRPEKNQAGALEMLARLRERIPGVELVFVGDGEIRPQLERRASELGGDWVHFLGFRDDVPALLAMADLMILPSTTDAMPMTILEAMALGVPVVASDVGDVSATLDGGGICVPAGDEAAFEQACASVLADDDLRATMSAAARAGAAEFDAGRMTERYSALFDGAVEGRSPRSAVSDPADARGRR